MLPAFWITRSNLGDIKIFTHISKKLKNLKHRKSLIQFSVFIYFYRSFQFGVFQLAWFILIGGKPGGSRGGEGGVHQGDPHHPLQLCSTTQERADMLSLWN